MRVLGIDIGSRTIKIVGLDRQEIVFFRVMDSGYNPIERAQQAVADLTCYDRIIATGYGRHSARSSFAHDIVTEIKAHGMGARYFYPNCRTVVDIGGQDSKVIKLNDAGQVVDFLMNDKCAAGTGKFLETMQKTLNISFADMVARAQQATEAITINSMCTVFAESEVVSLLNREVAVENIALGLVNSICQKVAGMVSRVGPEDDIVFTGGVACIPGMDQFLAQAIGKEKVHVPGHPQIVGALGAALKGYGELERTHA